MHQYIYCICILFAVLRLYIVLRWQWVGMVFHDVVIPFLHSFISVIFMTRHQVVYVHSINRRQFLMILSRDITEASESLYWQSNFGIFNKNNKKKMRIKRNERKRRPQNKEKELLRHKTWCLHMKKYLIRNFYFLQIRFHLFIMFALQFFTLFLTYSFIFLVINLDF